MKFPKTNVKYLNKCVEVNKEDRTVICELTSQVNVDFIPMFDFAKIHDKVISVFNKYSMNNNDNSEEDYKIFDLFEILSTGERKIIVKTIGKSKIAKNDKGEFEEEFNEELGKKIALTKAQEYTFKAIKELYEAILDICDDYANKIAYFIVNNEDSEFSCREHIDDLVNNFYGIDE